MLITRPARYWKFDIIYRRYSSIYRCVEITILFDSSGFRSINVIISRIVNVYQCVVLSKKANLAPITATIDIAKYRYFNISTTHTYRFIDKFQYSEWSCSSSSRKLAITLNRYDVIKVGKISKLGTMHCSFVYSRRSYVRGVRSISQKREFQNLT